MVPPAAVRVKFSVALKPPTVMEAPTPVPFGVAKLATLPPANEEVKGPAAVAPHFGALRALPSPAKNWSAASTATTPAADRAKRNAARKTQTLLNEPGFLFETPCFLLTEGAPAAFIDSLLERYSARSRHSHPRREAVRATHTRVASVQALSVRLCRIVAVFAPGRWRRTAGRKEAGGPVLVFVSPIQCGGRRRARVAVTRSGADFSTS